MTAPTSLISAYQFIGKPAGRFAALSLILVLATACQTTQGWQKEQEVDIQDTRIEFPNELINLKGFRIKKAMVREDGSYRRETIYFTGGYFSYDRYFHGGMLAINPHVLRKSIDKYYNEFKIDGEVHKINAAIGDIYYATLHGKGQTCIVMSGNVGTSMRLRSGPGYPGQTDGQYCEKGTVSGLADTAVKWMKRIKLR